MLCAWSVVLGGAGRKGESSQGEGGVFPPLNASAAEHPWAAMHLLPDCTPLVQLCLDYTSKHLAPLHFL